MPLSLASGDRLGAYEIVQPIGAGGMGEVYKALDTRLDRVVAIKVLPERFERDGGRRDRFEREARAVAALNHPHICQLHDVGEITGRDPRAFAPTRFLVMEHLEGQRLDERLVRGALPLPEVLRYAIELASALDHAHRHGIVHRDLKPGNVMLTASGTKLLDFGVSKFQQSRSVPALATVSLRDAHLTADGALLGTFPYMAPEQLQGREADLRSDIFAFGATVYEMATGRRPFDGETTASLIGAVLHSDPRPLSAIQPLAPPALDRIVSRCLAKDPNDRWQTARDLVLELQTISEPKTRSVQSGRRRTRIVFIAASALVLAASGVTLVRSGYLSSTTPADSIVQLAFAAPAGVIVSDLVVGGPVAISPSGDQLAFVATDADGKQLVWVRSLKSVVARPLPGTDGGAYPFWSPDGQSLGFFAQRKLKTVQLAGGPPQVLSEAVLPRGGTWSRDGQILFSAGAGRQLYRVRSAGGERTRLETDEQNDERHWPSFLPDGRHFVYFGRPQKHGIYVAAVDSPKATLLLSDYVGVAYAPPGYLLVLRGPSRGAPSGTLLAYRFDPASLQLTGDGVPIAERVRYESGVARGAFTVSDAGTLVYGDIQTASTELTWFDRSGKTIGAVGRPFALGQPSLSPDEKTIAVERVDPITQDQDLWLIDVSRNIPSRLTSQGNNITFMPVWSQDGAWLVFASARGSPPNLYRKASTGDGNDELLRKSPTNNQPTDWSRDGRFIVYADLNPATQWDLWLMPTDSGDERGPIPVVNTEFNEHLGRISPDGRWIAYVSDESGANEVYVKTLSASGATRRISVSGGTEPKWRADGRELFFLGPDGTLMAVVVSAGSQIDTGSPTPLFSVRLGPTRNFGYDVNYAATRDAQRFLISTLTPRSDPSPTTTVILNWQATLTAR
jgi:serine/threonine protein kinase/Tol biopolymer transport system component